MNKTDLEIGDKIHCHSWRDLKNTAFHLSCEGYGIEIIGYGDLMEYVLTITALPERE